MIRNFWQGEKHMKSLFSMRTMLCRITSKISVYHLSSILEKWMYGLQIYVKREGTTNSQFLRAKENHRPHQEKRKDNSKKFDFSRSWRIDRILLFEEKTDLDSQISDENIEKRKFLKLVVFGRSIVKKSQNSKWILFNLKHDQKLREIWI